MTQNILASRCRAKSDDEQPSAPWFTDLVYALRFRLLRSPYCILVLGAVLFGLFGTLDKKSGEAPAKFVVTTSRIAMLAEQFARTWRRPPNEQELQDLVENYIRDEIYYREGRAAGLDRDDVVIRRRVRQKMEFSRRTWRPPSQAANNSLLTLRPIQTSSYRRPADVSPGFFERNAAWWCVGRRCETDRRHAAYRAQRPGGHGDSWRPILLGDAFHRRLPRKEIAQTFGEEFAEKVIRGPSRPLA